MNCNTFNFTLVADVSRMRCSTEQVERSFKSILCTFSGKKRKTASKYNYSINEKKKENIEVIQNTLFTLRAYAFVHDSSQNETFKS